jgi:hypothetical protein
MYDNSTQALYVGSLPTDIEFDHIIQGVLPSISNKPIITLEGQVEEYIDESRPMCFDRLFVGAPTPLFTYQNEPYAEGREELMMAYRTRILQHYEITECLPADPIIYITHKSSSTWAKKEAHGRHRAIANIHELLIFLVAQLPHVRIEQVEWPKKTFKEQLSMRAHTPLLTTPCGGVSMVIPFLPDGAHAIVMDYLSSGDQYERERGYEKGQSVSMDSIFLDRFPHVTKYFYQIYSEEDLDWDFEGATDLRNDASVKVDFDRMLDLVVSALLSMGYELQKT